MNLSHSTRKYILIGIVLIVLAGLISACSMGKKQDAAYQINDLEYSQVVQQIQEGNFVGALEASKTLESNQSNSEQVNYMIALAAANSGEIEKGLIHMQKTLDLNPHKVEDSMFMLQLAQFLMIAERTDEAGLVLERCTTLPTPETYPNYQEDVAQLQQQLAAQS